MIEPDERSAEEVEQMIDSLQQEVAKETHEAARGFIEKMKNNDNRVMQNPYGNPVVELIAPTDIQDEVEAVIEEWDLNPQGHGVMGQSPSFEEKRPEVSRGLVAWQFLLQEDEPEALDSCGYDLETIMEELENEPVMASQARKVKATLPW